MSKIKLCIVNRDYPPYSKGITAKCANELAKTFIGDNTFDVHVVHTDGEYPGDFKYDAIHGTTHVVKAYYNGKKKIPRLLGNIRESRQLIKKAKSILADFYIINTSPPFNNFFAATHLKSWVLWSMDLYPEAFVASKLVSKNNLFVHIFNRKLLKNPPSRILALGHNQATYLENKFNLDKRSSFVLPAGIKPHSKNENLPKWYDPSKLTFAYCGNLGEAHSLDFLQEFIKQLNPNLHNLVLSVYGSKSEKLINTIDKNKVSMVDFIDNDQMPYVDIHLISLLPEWNHICVPSKAISAICNKGAMLFFGSQESDNWNMLQKAGWLIKTNKSLEFQIRTFLERLSKTDIQNKKSNASLIFEDLYKLEKTTLDNLKNHFIQSYNNEQ